MILIYQFIIIFNPNKMLTKLMLFSKFLFSGAGKKFDTIYALATGVNTAISIVRVGGPDAYRALQLLQKNHHNKRLSENELKEEIGESNPIKNKPHQFYIQPRKAHFRNIFNSEGEIIDQCIILYFPPEHSYNNQQIIQFHLHGSKAIVNSIFKQFKAKGFRMADRGQFTKRALLNGKINLIQAQSINDLIKSESQFERQIAINNMLGKGKQFLQGVKDQLIKCLANNEAYIDFQQDESDVKSDLFVKNKEVVKKVLKNIYKILENYKNLQIIKQGINITIVGKPNVGKSTLINALAKKQIAIVSQEPGTTRDILQAQIECGGVLVNLYDTAGLRETRNKIESQGIRRAKMKAKESQINLLVIDLAQEETKEVINQNGVKEIQIMAKQSSDQDSNYSQIVSKNTIVIINKGDQLPKQCKQRTKFFFNVQNINEERDEEFSQQISVQNKKIYADLVISAQSPQQINRLTTFLESKIKKQYSLYQTSQEIYFTRERYFNKLQKCAEYLENYIEQQRPDIACENLRLSIQEISEIFGKVDVEDVLDVLFRQFCIGK